MFLLKLTFVIVYMKIARTFKLEGLLLLPARITLTLYVSFPFTERTF